MAGWGILGENKRHPHPMNIADIIAAKQAAKQNQPTPAPEPTKSELESEAAIDRIDPPGKRHTPIILGKRFEPEPEILPPSQHPDRRSLGTTETEAIPVVPVDADQATTTWHAALNAFESEVCLMRDPVDPERGWIAVRLSGQEDHPILLKSFMLFDHPRASTTPDPF